MSAEMNDSDGVMISNQETYLGNDSSQSSVEDESLVESAMECSRSSSDVDVKQLTLKLLTSPENLDFALEHQQEKILELKEKMLSLLGIKSEGPIKYKAAGFTKDEILEKELGGNITNDGYPLQKTLTQDNPKPSQETRQNDILGHKIESKPEIPISAPSPSVSKLNRNNYFSQHTIKVPLENTTNVPSPSPSLVPLTQFRPPYSLDNLQESPLSSPLGIIPRDNGDMPQFHRSKRHRTTSRSKNRNRERYIQLPPTFKYPEPIDVSSVR